jgi:DNA mismatch endonuclease (patch repair protein)
MTDPFTPKQRSAVMRAVKSDATGPERRVRALVRAQGRRYRLGGWGLPGKPDLVFPGHKRAIFVHGCFWHGHDCSRGARAPKANAAYWQGKIDRNRARDATTLHTLSDLGWRTLVIWECELVDPDQVKARLGTFLS